MMLYHWTYKQNLHSILKQGLKPNGIGIVYLTPQKQPFGFGNHDALLQVETGNKKLTTFEGCEDWEVLCWGYILPKNIKQIQLNEIRLVQK